MLERLDNIKTRLNFQGGVPQQDRMIRDKKRSLQRALSYSYQGANVKLLGSNEARRALINPDKTKQNYDDKIISIYYEYGFKPGDVFDWENTGTKWLIYLQDLTELAYFRGEIRKCRYTIDFMDDDGKEHRTYAAVRGPVETKINFIQKAGISVDEPNHTLNILLPKNKDTLKYFKRYGRFYINDYDICWKVEGFDSISMPGIIEITAVEDYSNKDIDNIEEGIANAFVARDIEPEDPGLIEGNSFIKPKATHTYIYTGLQNADWVIETQLPIQCEKNGKEIKIKSTSSYSGQINLKYGDTEKLIIVESLF